MDEEEDDMTEGHVRVKALTGKEMVHWTLADCRQAMFESYRLAIKLEARYYRAARRVNEEETAEQLDEAQREDVEAQRREERRLDNVQRSKIRRKVYSESE